MSPKTHTVVLFTLIGSFLILSYPVRLLQAAAWPDDNAGAFRSQANGHARRLALAGPAGACCQADGSCSVTTQITCDSIPGTFQGPGTVCLGDADGDGRDDACPCATPLDCDDGNDCTEDMCTSAVCSHADSLISTPCDLDGLFCTADTCNGAGTCVAGGSPCPGPDHDNDCSESCNETARNCTANDPNGSICNDGSFCTGTDTCDNVGLCSNHTGDPCPGPDNDNNCSESCNEAANNCTANDPNGSFCNDGLFCTVGTFCTSGSCGGGSPRNCSDSVFCTMDLCSESADTCLHKLLPMCTDCNGNGIPDECDISCGCPGGPCFVSGCGVLDDCNLNGLPDECDIATGTSADANGDMIPDECVQPISGTHNWTDNIWGLGGSFPDNTAGVSGLYVTLPPGRVITLNAAVTIEGLRIRNTAVLKVNQPLSDLTINPLTPGGILDEGTILVGLDRTIDVTGNIVTIGDGGKYLADPADPTTTALLRARSVVILPPSCVFTEQMTLSGGMRVETTEDFVMDATNCSLCVPIGAKSAAPLGGKTPPILRLERSSFFLTADAPTEAAGDITRLDVGGSFRMLDAAEVMVGGGTGSFLPNVMLHGDFDNQSLVPSMFDWTSGKLTLTGGTHMFEVAGADRGPEVSGLTGNFSIATVEVLSGSSVDFVNAQPNTAGTGPLSEASYINRLVLQSGSTLSVGNDNVYDRKLFNNGATINQSGQGTLSAIGIPTVSQWGLVVMALLLVTAGALVTMKRAAAARKTQ